MAAALRLEKVHISRRDGLAKIIGTVACVNDATIIALYKDPRITHLWHPNLEVTATYFKHSMVMIYLQKLRTGHWGAFTYLEIVWHGQARLFYSHQF